MRNLSEIRELLDELDYQPADALEDQDLDFKQWKTRSVSDAVALVVEMAICMANGGGGTVVFGVNDREVGRSKAILGVPHEVDVNRLKKAVYDSTDPKLTPVFQELVVPEGTHGTAHRHAGLSGSSALYGYQGTWQDPRRQRLPTAHRNPSASCDGGNRGDRFYCQPSAGAF